MCQRAAVAFRLASGSTADRADCIRCTRPAEGELLSLVSSAWDR